MIISQDIFNQKCMTQEYVFNSEVLGGEVRVRDLSMYEMDEFKRMFEEDRLIAMFYAASRMCVEPQLPETAYTDGKQALGAFVNELMSESPFFGMTKEDRDEAIKKRDEVLLDNQEKEVPTKEAKAKK